MRPSRTRRKSPGFEYIGAGNKTSVFTSRPKSPFSKIKSIYGEELNRLNLKKAKQKLSFKVLTEKEKDEIRKRVKAELIADQKRQAIAGTILLLIVLTIFIVIRFLVLGE